MLSSFIHGYIEPPLCGRSAPLLMNLLQNFRFYSGRWYITNNQHDNIDKEIYPMTSLLSKLTICLLIGSSLIFLNGCQGGTEQEAIEAAIKTLRENAVGQIIRPCTDGVEEIKDVQARVLRRDDLSRADQENGIEHRVYLNVTYIIKCKDKPTWHDGDEKIYFEKRAQSDWKISNKTYENQ